MHRKFGNRRVDHRGPIDLMYNPSNIEVDLCWC